MEGGPWASLAYSGANKQSRAQSLTKIDAELFESSHPPSPCRTGARSLETKDSGGLVLTKSPSRQLSQGVNRSGLGHWGP